MKPLETTPQSKPPVEAAPGGTAPARIPPAPPLPGQQEEEPDTDVSVYVPKPEVPAQEIGEVAQRISWLRSYSGGDCFYATALSATDKAIDIEGFGTGVEPFMQMLKAFQERFNMEPDINVRLIEPAQCEVTQFLRQLGETPGDRPDLTLNRTSVPSGAPISGTLGTRGGLRANLLLIDHKGMVFNLDQRIRIGSGQSRVQHPDRPEFRRPGQRQDRAADHRRGDRRQGYRRGRFFDFTPASVVLPKRSLPKCAIAAWTVRRPLNISGSAARH